MLTSLVDPSTNAATGIHALQDRFFLICIKDFSLSSLSLYFCILNFYFIINKEKEQKKNNFLRAININLAWLQRGPKTKSIQEKKPFRLWPVK